LLLLLDEMARWTRIASKERVVEGAMAKNETNDARGTMEGDRGDAKAQPSGPRGDNPATAGRGETSVNSNTAENAEGRINPSAPGQTGTTPGSNG
jgi:hypothetical protein